MSGGRTIGSLETWEPEDKSFSKHVLKEGQGDTKPNEGSVITVNITLLAEYEFCEGALGGYRFGGDCEATIGEGDTAISELLDKIIESMKEGETCYVKSKMDAKGEKVSEIGVDNKSLKFNMTLLSLNRAADVCELEPDEKLDRAQHHKEKGTDLYKDERTDFAVKRFQKALGYLQDMDPLTTLPDLLKERHKQLLCQCFLNLGACHIKAEKYEKVVENCTKAMEIGGENVKGLFRRGQAQIKLFHYDKAKLDLTKALKLEPENKAVWNQIRAVDELIKKEKQMYQKMFPK